jgi:hypothetical protein
LPVSFFSGSSVFAAGVVAVLGAVGLVITPNRKLGVGLAVAAILLALLIDVAFIAAFALNSNKLPFVRHILGGVISAALIIAPSISHWNLGPVVLLGSLAVGRSEREALAG